MISFAGLPPEVMQSMCTPMHLILPPATQQGYSSQSSSAGNSQNSGPTSHAPGALYLGSLTAVNDHELLRSKRITHLVQVLDIPWVAQVPEKDGMSYYRIDILDSPGVDIVPHLEAVCDWIGKALRSGGNVLVHCQQVRNRLVLGLYFLASVPALLQRQQNLIWMYALTTFMDAFSSHYTRFFARYMRPHHCLRSCNNHH
jgi:hypothetical protein